MHGLWALILLLKTILASDEANLCPDSSNRRPFDINVKVSSLDNSN